ncbi:MAG: oligosaccharide flippase family protein, partial [Lysobacterales bacterium]
VAARTLGAAQFGILILINLVVVTIGDLTVFPGWYAIIRFGSPGFENADSMEFRKLLSFSICLELCSGVAAVMLAAAVAPLVAPLLGIPTRLMPVLLVFSLAALSSARSTPAAILYLGERFNTLAIQQALAGLVRLAGAVVAYLSDTGLSGFVYAWLLANLAEAGFMWLFALIELRRRSLLKLTVVSPLGISRIYPDIWRFSIATKLNKSLEDISPRITPFAVGLVLEPMAVGLYHVAFRLGMLLAQPVIVLVGSVYPELTRLVRDNDLLGLRRVVVRSGLVAAIIGSPLFLIYVLFGDLLLEWIGGEGFGQAYPVLVMIAAAQLIGLLGFPLGSALQAAGRPGLVLRVNLIAITVLFPGLIGLLHVLGLIGAGVYAVTLSTLVVSVLGTHWWKQSRRHEALLPESFGLANKL